MAHLERAYRLNPPHNPTVQKGRAMRALIVIPFLLALGACAADGSIKNPLELTPAERCANARQLLMLAEMNDLSPELVAKAKANVDAFCPMP